MRRDARAIASDTGIVTLTNAAASQYKPYVSYGEIVVYNIVIFTLSSPVPPLFARVLLAAVRALCFAGIERVECL